MGTEKVVYAPMGAYSVEAVQNGYKLIAGKSPAADVSANGVLVSNGSTIWYSSSDGCDWSRADKAKPAKKAKPAPRVIYTSGEYVFPDFASLTAFLKQRLKHGRGVKPE